MALKIIEIHPSESDDLLNSEWFVLENQGQRPFNTRTCTLTVHKKGAKKRAALGVIDPGFVLGPGEKIRVVTGNPGKKAQGAMPDDAELKNYSLFLGSPVLRGTGTVLTVALRGLAVASAEYQADAPSGVLER